MKIAYSISAHRNPSQVKRLLKSIYSKEDFYYLSVFGDKTAEGNWETEIFEIDPTIYVSHKCGKCWGMFPVAEAIIDSMKYFSAFDYDYFINLTGQCYPLSSISKIKTTLNNQTAAFMEVHPLPYTNWGSMGGLDRFHFSYYKHPIFGLYDWLVNKLLKDRNYETRRFVKFPKQQKNLPYGFLPYGGSAYFCITKAHVMTILDSLNQHPNLLSFYRNSFACDEMIFQTILANSEHRNDIISNNLRYIDWSKPGEYRLSPALLTINDAYKLLDSSAFFARKFDMCKDSKILDLLDEHINAENELYLQKIVS